jgi:hypothetical protein
VGRGPPTRPFGSKEDPIDSTARRRAAPIPVSDLVDLGANKVRGFLRHEFSLRPYELFSKVLRLTAEVVAAETKHLSSVSHRRLRRNAARAICDTIIKHHEEPDDPECQLFGTMTAWITQTVGAHFRHLPSPASIVLNWGVQNSLINHGKTTSRSTSADRGALPMRLYNRADLCRERIDR